MGTYEDQSPKIKRKSPQFKMGQRTSSDLEKILKTKASLPGPSNYQPFNTSLSNIGYTMAGQNLPKVSTRHMTSKMRQSLESFHINPGPGEYTMTKGSFDFDSGADPGLLAS